MRAEQVPTRFPSAVFLAIILLIFLVAVGSTIALTVTKSWDAYKIFMVVVFFVLTALLSLCYAGVRRRNFGMSERREVSSSF